MWIKTNLGKINAKIIFGNGGSIDFWSGKTKGAPVNIGNDCFIFSNVITRVFKSSIFAFLINSRWPWWSPSKLPIAQLHFSKSGRLFRLFI